MLKGHVVLNSTVLCQQGCYKRTRYWIKGHHNLESVNTTIRYIAGYTGPETEVTIETITALRTFDVAPAIIRIAA